MRTRLNFTNLPSSEALARSIDTELHDLEHFAPHKHIDAAKVQLRIVNSRQHPGPDLHECSIELNVGHASGGKRVFIKKTKDNMYKAIASAFDAAQRILRERLSYKKRRAHRQRNVDPFDGNE